MSFSTHRDFHGSTFATSVSYGPLSTPAYFDYMHLVFWFFFLTSFIISVWLVQLFYFLIRGSDRLFLIRETRGFSRAQTGDAITAVIPMTWSITMLMHASTHSSNFDENTDSTSLSMTVIAYQWGWNYFFPRDTISTSEPVSQLTQSDNLSAYSFLKSHDFFDLDVVANELYSNISNLTHSYASCHTSGYEIADDNYGLSSCLFDECHALNIDLDLMSDDASGLSNYEEVGFCEVAYPTKTSLYGPNSVSSKAEGVISPFSEFNSVLYKNSNNLASGLVSIPNYANTSCSVLSSVSIRTPSVLEDIDQKFFSCIELAEVSSSRLSINVDHRAVSTFGGLTHRMFITSGVVLPVDTAIHIICGSKDVIHSWAIPGLFIKIDCIPGYNCHRRLLIRWRGLFWGQCMEVCGRYHHWMPILIKTTHYDLFILWLSSINNK